MHPIEPDDPSQLHSSGGGGDAKPSPAEGGEPSPRGDEAVEGDASGTPEETAAPAVASTDGPAPDAPAPQSPVEEHQDGASDAADSEPPADWHDGHDPEGHEHEGHDAHEAQSHGHEAAAAGDPSGASSTAHGGQPAQGAAAHASADSARRLPQVRGVIQALEDEEAVVLLDDGRTARMRKLDLADASGRIAAQPGDRVEALEAPPEEGATDGAVRLKRRANPRAEALAALADTFQSRTPLDGRVTSAIKGGYEIRINGLRAFCPSSQIALRRDDLPGDPVGKTLQFVLTKYDPTGRSLVVSRRKLLEKEHKKLAAGTRTQIVKGARLTGTVVSFQPYGAFVDLGGIQGLLHVSEVSHSRMQDPRDLLTVGQEIEVLVLKHDPTFKKVSLSMKALAGDPWEQVGPSLATGQVHRGRLRQVAGIGAFVEIAPGVEGLMQAGEEPLTLEPAGGAPAVAEAAPESAAEPSAAPEHAAAPTTREVLVQIADVDARRRRIGLVRPPDGSQPGDVVQPPKVEVGAKIHGVIERVAPFGAFVRLAPGRVGLLHATESGTPPGSDLVAAFPIGTRVEVEILEISEDGQRIRLSRRTSDERAQRAQRPEGARGPGAPGQGGFDGPRAPSGPGGGGFGSRSQGERPQGGRPQGGPGGERSGERPQRGDRPRGDRGGDRRPPREGGGGDDRRGPRREREQLQNPAAAPRSGFASLGDLMKEKLERREPVDST